MNTNSIAGKNQQEAAGLTPQQNQLLALFGAMSDAYQGNALIVMQTLAQSFPRQRPQLRLVVGSAA